MPSNSSGENLLDHFPPWLLQAIAFVIRNFPYYGEDNEYVPDAVDSILVLAFDKVTHQGEGLLYFAVNHQRVIPKSDWFENFMEFDLEPVNRTRRMGRVVPPDMLGMLNSFGWKGRRDFR
jgi:hypothetical protein